MEEKPPFIPVPAKGMPKEELLTYKKHYCTVGRLKEFIKEHNIPDDALILSQRVEDYYYVNNHWNVYKKYGEGSGYMLRHNEKVDEGYYKDKENFPIEHPIHTRKYSQEEIDANMDEYTPIWSPVFYKDEDSNDILFLDLHY